MFVEISLHRIIVFDRTWIIDLSFWNFIEFKVLCVWMNIFYRILVIKKKLFLNYIRVSASNSLLGCEWTWCGGDLKVELLTLFFTLPLPDMGTTTCSSPLPEMTSLTSSLVHVEMGEVGVLLDSGVPPVFSKRTRRRVSEILFYKVG